MNSGRHRAYPIHRHRSKAGKGRHEVPCIDGIPAKTGSGAEPQAIREFAQYVIQDGHGIVQSLPYAKLPKPIHDRA